jgi:hypothetical protein
MKKYLLSLLIIAFTISLNAQSMKTNNKNSVCSNNCEAKNKSGNLSCKLTTTELRQRKETVIKSLKSQVITKKPLKNGYAYKFVGTDKMVDELAEFIKTERACCDFFVFNLSINGDKSMAILEITGPKGAKDFIDSELEL